MTMIPIEEAIRAQRYAGRALSDPRFGAWENKAIFDNPAEAIQTGGCVLQAPLYTWAQPIKHLVDAAAATYPLAQAVDAIHFFHQPSMFWLLDESIVDLAIASHHRASVDAVLLSPWRQATDARDILNGMRDDMRAMRGTPEDRRRYNDYVLTACEGVRIIGFSSLRTGAPIDFSAFKSEHFPSGSRLPVPMITKTVRFRDDPGNHGEITNDDDPTLLGELSALTRWVLAACALLKQRILQVVPDRGTHAERKRLARDELPVGVMTIALRATEHQSPTGQSAVDWSHRWIVRGHWRQQWYPSDQAHRVIWVPPYIKGPDDRPLVVREAVYAVNR